MTAYEFKEFGKMFSIEHNIATPYDPRSNGKAELFVCSLKRALKKANNEKQSEEALQKSLRLCRQTENPNKTTGMSSTRKNKSVFHKMLPGQK